MNRYSGNRLLAARISTYCSMHVPEEVMEERARREISKVIPRLGIPRLPPEGLHFERENKGRASFSGSEPVGVVKE